MEKKNINDLLSRGYKINITDIQNQSFLQQQFKETKIPEFNREPQEVKIIEEPKSKIEEFANKHSGKILIASTIFAFSALIISLISLFLNS